MNTITIVGGGVAGLALAAALEPQRWRATLIEQRPVLPDVGTAFGIWPIARRALTFLGLGDWLGAECVRVTDGAIRGVDDEPIVRMRNVDMAQTHRDFPAPVQRVLAEAEVGRTLVNRILISPLTRRLVRGRYVLIGDAAHAMSPSLGRGACEALVDAVALAHELNRRDPEEALRAYQRQRLLPGQAVRTAASVALRLQEAGPRVHRLLAALG